MSEKNRDTQKNVASMKLSLLHFPISNFFFLVWNLFPTLETPLQKKNKNSLWLYMCSIFFPEYSAAMSAPLLFKSRDLFFFSQLLHVFYRIPSHEGATWKSVSAPTFPGRNSLIGWWAELYCWLGLFLFLFWFRFDFCGAAFVPCVNVLEEGQLNKFRLIGDRNISRRMKIKGGIQLHRLIHAIP